MAGLRVRRDAEQHGRAYVASGSAQKPVAGRRRHLFVQPQEIREEYQREEENLRRQENEIHRNACGSDEGQRERQRRSWARARREEHVPAHAHAEQQQHVQDEDPVQAEQPHERCGDDWICEGLAEVEAVVPRIGRSQQSNERGRGVKTDAKLLASLEEDAVGPPAVQSNVPLEVASLVAQVVIVGDAERHRHVGGFVALDALACFHDIDRHRGRERDDEENGSAGGGEATRGRCNRRAPR